MALPILISLLALGYILCFAGIFTKISLIRIMGAMLITILGISTIASGIDGLSNLITLAVGSVSIALGCWFMVQDLFKEKFMEESDDEDED